jgi:hypothetical protein
VTFKSGENVTIGPSTALFEGTFDLCDNLGGSKSGSNKKVSTNQKFSTSGRSSYAGSFNKRSSTSKLYGI